MAFHYKEYDYDLQILWPKRGFQKLTAFIASYKDSTFDPSDIEENELRSYFRKYNVINENKGSTTIRLENGREEEWELVLIATYGAPNITLSKHHPNRQIMKGHHWF